ncbi:MAG: hypothetical protein AAF804_07610, partial [Bacteroidota bacterium]
KSRTEFSGTGQFPLSWIRVVLRRRAEESRTEFSGTGQFPLFWIRVVLRRRADDLMKLHGD